MMISIQDKERDALLDELLKGCKSPKDLLGKGGLIKDLTKRLFERALAGELTEHLGRERHARSEATTDKNDRNGTTPKTVETDSDAIEIEVPRDRSGTFEPQIIPKRQRRLEGFDDKVIAMYARGRTTREIQEELAELYGVEVSPTLISNVTASVLDDVRQWQSRPLDAIYPILYIDALFVKSREAGPVKNKAVYLALGINMSGEKELLGLWMNETEGSKFWMSVFTELKSRGCPRLHCRLCGRPQGASRSDRSSVPGGIGTAVYSPQGTQLAEVCFMERTPPSPRTLRRFMPHRRWMPPRVR